MNIEHHIEHEHLVLRPQTTRIDAFEAVEFKEHVRKISQSHHTDVALWLDKVDFIDSSGLGAIVGAMKRLGPDKKMRLIALQPAVARVFELTQMNRVFDIFADIEHFRAEVLA